MEVSGARSDIIDLWVMPDHLYLAKKHHGSINKFGASWAEEMKITSAHLWLSRLQALLLIPLWTVVGTNSRN